MDDFLKAINKMSDKDNDTDYEQQCKKSMDRYLYGKMPPSYKWARGGFPYSLFQKYNDVRNITYKSEADHVIDLNTLSWKGSIRNNHMNKFRFDTFKGLYKTVFSKYDFIIIDMECDIIKYGNEEDTPFLSEYYKGLFPTYVVYESGLSEKFNSINTHNLEVDFKNYAYVFSLPNGKHVITTRISAAKSVNLNAFIQVANPSKCCLLSRRSEYYTNKFICDIYTVWNKLYSVSEGELINSYWVTAKGTDAEKDIGPVIFNSKYFCVEYNNALRRYVLSAKYDSDAQYSSKSLFGLTSIQGMFDHIVKGEFDFPDTVTDFTNMCYNSETGNWLPGEVIYRNEHYTTVQCISNLDIKELDKLYARYIDECMIGNKTYRKEWKDTHRIIDEIRIIHFDITDYVNKNELSDNKIDSIMSQYLRSKEEYWGGGSSYITVVDSNRISKTELDVVLHWHDSGD